MRLGESGRDQAHTQLGIGHQAEACQIAWNQGIDIWSDLSDRYEHSPTCFLFYSVICL